MIFLIMAYSLSLLFWVASGNWTLPASASAALTLSTIANCPELMYILPVGLLWMFREIPGQERETDPDGVPYSDTLINVFDTVGFLVGELFMLFMVKSGLWG